MKHFFFTLFLCLGLVTVSHASLPDFSGQRENIILPEGVHYLLGKGFDGSIVELENGAQFGITLADQAEVCKWKTYAILTISPNPYWFSDDDFLLTNCHTNAHVRAKYLSSPSLTNPFTYFVEQIHPWTGEIILTDLADNLKLWRVDPRDIKHTQNWQPGDTVVVGYYDIWYSKLLSKKRYILMSYENSDRVKFIRASPGF